MKKLLPLALSVLFVFSPPAAHAAEDQIPMAGMEAIGALAAMNAYIGHVALGRIAAADHTGPANLKTAAQDSGGIQAGLNSGVEYINKAKANAPKSEHEGLDALSNMTALCAKQAGALIDLLKAKAGGTKIKEAQAGFDAARLACAKSINKNLTIPLEILK